jgi:hypothetical protein
MSNINIARRFSNVESAILALESEGKLDISYNRPQALQDVKFLDRTPRASVSLVFADDADQLWYVINHEGERLLHKYSPFCSILSSGPLSLYYLDEDRNVVRDLQSRIRNDRKSRRAAVIANVLISSAS